MPKWSCSLCTTENHFAKTKCASCGATKNGKLPAEVLKQQGRILAANNKKKHGDGGGSSKGSSRTPTPALTPTPSSAIAEQQQQQQSFSQQDNTTKNTNNNKGKKNKNAASSSSSQSAAAAAVLSTPTPSQQQGDKQGEKQQQQQGKGDASSWKVPPPRTTKATATVTVTVATKTAKANAINGGSSHQSNNNSSSSIKSRVGSRTTTPMATPRGKKGREGEGEAETDAGGGGGVGARSRSATPTAVAIKKQLATPAIPQPLKKGTTTAASSSSQVKTPPPTPAAMRGKTASSAPSPTPPAKEIVGKGGKSKMPLKTASNAHSPPPPPANIEIGSDITEKEHDGIAASFSISANDGDHGHDEIRDAKKMNGKKSLRASSRRTLADHDDDDDDDDEIGEKSQTQTSSRKKLRAESASTFAVDCTASTVIASCQSILTASSSSMLPRREHDECDSDDASTSSGANDGADVSSAKKKRAAVVDEGGKERGGDDCDHDSLPLFPSGESEGCGAVAPLDVLLAGPSVDKLEGMRNNNDNTTSRDEDIQPTLILTAAAVATTATAVANTARSDEAAVSLTGKADGERNAADNDARSSDETDTIGEATANTDADAGHSDHGDDANSCQNASEKVVSSLFSTAGGKPVTISKKYLEAASNKMKEIDNGEGIQWVQSSSAAHDGGTRGVTRSNLGRGGFKAPMANNNLKPPALPSSNSVHPPPMTLYSSPSSSSATTTNSAPPVSAAAGTKNLHQAGADPFSSIPKFGGGGGGGGDVIVSSLFSTAAGGAVTISRKSLEAAKQKHFPGEEDDDKPDDDSAKNNQKDQGAGGADKIVSSLFTSAGGKPVMISRKSLAEAEQKLNHETVGAPKSAQREGDDSLRNDAADDDAYVSNKSNNKPPVPTTAASGPKIISTLFTSAAGKPVLISKDKLAEARRKLEDSSNSDANQDELVEGEFSNGEKNNRHNAASSAAAGGRVELTLFSTASGQRVSVSAASMRKAKDIISAEPTLFETGDGKPIKLTPEALRKGGEILRRLSQLGDDDDDNSTSALPMRKKLEMEAHDGGADEINDGKTTIRTVVGSKRGRSPLSSSSNRVDKEGQNNRDDNDDDFNDDDDSYYLHKHRSLASSSTTGAASVCSRGRAAAATSTTTMAAPATSTGLHAPAQQRAGLVGRLSAGGVVGGSGLIGGNISLGGGGLVRGARKAFVPPTARAPPPNPPTAAAVAPVVVPNDTNNTATVSTVNGRTINYGNTSRHASSSNNNNAANNNANHTNAVKTAEERTSTCGDKTEAVSSATSGSTLRQIFYELPTSTENDDNNGGATTAEKNNSNASHSHSSSFALVCGYYSGMPFSECAEYEFPTLAVKSPIARRLLFGEREGSNMATAAPSSASLSSSAVQQQSHPLRPLLLSDTDALFTAPHHYRAALLSLGADARGCSLEWVRNALTISCWLATNMPLFHTPPIIHASSSSVDQNKKLSHHKQQDAVNHTRDEGNDSNGQHYKCCYTPEHALAFLVHRYNDEYVSGNRSALKKICEKDLPSTSRMALWVVQTNQSGAHKSQQAQHGITATTTMAAASASPSAAHRATMSSSSASSLHHQHPLNVSSSSPSTTASRRTTAVSPSKPSSHHHHHNHQASPSSLLNEDGHHHCHSNKMSKATAQLPPSHPNPSHPVALSAAAAQTYHAPMNIPLMGGGGGNQNAPHSNNNASTTATSSSSAASSPSSNRILVSDGCYVVTAVVDGPTTAMLADRIIIVGTLIELWGATSQSENAGTPLEVGIDAAVLGINYNGVKVHDPFTTLWHPLSSATTTTTSPTSSFCLGLLPISPTDFPAIPIRRIHHLGGAVPSIIGTVTRVLPPHFQERSDVLGGDIGTSSSGGGGGRRSGRGGDQGRSARTVRNKIAEEKRNDLVMSRMQKETERLIEITTTTSNSSTAAAGPLSFSEREEIMQEVRSKFARDVNIVCTIIIEDDNGNVAVVQQWMDGTASTYAAMESNVPKEGQKIRLFNLHPSKSGRTMPPFHGKMLFARPTFNFLTITPASDAATLASDGIGAGEQQQLFAFERRAYNALDHFEGSMSNTMVDVCCVVVDVVKTVHLSVAPPSSAASLKAPPSLQATNENQQSYAGANGAAQMMVQTHNSAIPANTDITAIIFCASTPNIFGALEIISTPHLELTLPCPPSGTAIVIQNIVFKAFDRTSGPQNVVRFTANEYTCILQSPSNKQLAQMVKAMDGAEMRKKIGPTIQCGQQLLKEASALDVSEGGGHACTSFLVRPPLHHTTTNILLSHINGAATDGLPLSSSSHSPRVFAPSAVLLPTDPVDYAVCTGSSLQQGGGGGGSHSLSHRNNRSLGGVKLLGGGGAGGSTAALASSNSVSEKEDGGGGGRVSTASNVMMTSALLGSSSLTDLRVNRPTLEANDEHEGGEANETLGKSTVDGNEAFKYDGATPSRNLFVENQQQQSLSNNHHRNALLSPMSNDEDDNANQHGTLQTHHTHHSSATTSRQTISPSAALSKQDALPPPPPPPPISSSSSMHDDEASLASPHPLAQHQQLVGGAPISTSSPTTLYNAAPKRTLLFPPTGATTTATAATIEATYSAYSNGSNSSTSPIITSPSTNTSATAPTTMTTTTLAGGGGVNNGRTFNPPPTLPGTVKPSADDILPPRDSNAGGGGGAVNGSKSPQASNTTSPTKPNSNTGHNQQHSTSVSPTKKASRPPPAPIPATVALGRLSAAIAMAFPIESGFVPPPPQPKVEEEEGETAASALKYGDEKDDDNANVAATASTDGVALKKRKDIFPTIFEQQKHQFGNFIPSSFVLKVRCGAQALIQHALTDFTSSSFSARFRPPTLEANPNLMILQQQQHSPLTSTKDADLVPFFSLDRHSVMQHGLSASLVASFTNGFVSVETCVEGIDAIGSLLSEMVGSATTVSSTAAVTEEEWYQLSIARASILSKLDSEDQRWRCIVLQSAVVTSNDLSLCVKEVEESQNDEGSQRAADNSVKMPRVDHNGGAKTTEIDFAALGVLKRWNQSAFVDPLQHVLWWHADEWKNVQQCIYRSFADRLVKITVVGGGDEEEENDNANLQPDSDGKKVYSLQACFPIKEMCSIASLI